MLFYLTDGILLYYIKMKQNIYIILIEKNTDAML